MRIIFMGTPGFAVASLQALVENGKEIVAVVTSPDKPAGRGQKLMSSAVKEYALTQNIPVLQPEKLKDPEFIEDLRSYRADLQVVVAFRMLPEVVWNMPPFGTINVHASLLPNYRGAAPIHHAILNGETETGVTTFLLQHQIDTGNILLSEKVRIEESDNTGSLHDKLMHVGAKLLVRTVDALAKGQIEPIPQNTLSTSMALKEAPKIFKEHGLIDWEKGVQIGHNLIRGLSPSPGAYTFLNGKMLKIFAGHISAIEQDEQPDRIGKWETDGKTYLRFACPDGWIYADDVQLEGKKRLGIADFLRGLQLQNP